MLQGSIYPSICISVYLFVYLPICIPAYLSICPFVYLSIYLSIYPFVYLSSVNESIYPRIYLLRISSTRAIAGDMLLTRAGFRALSGL